jgi:phosphate starvation-inducible PhoH-like protein
MNFSFVSKQTKQIGPRTKGQREYVEAIKEHDMCFGIGPAGTGKTYLAMACAVDALKTSQVRRIILTRPAIEAGESLGFLPGDMYEKILPYLRPLYDAIYDMMEAERIEKYLDTGIIEVAPLAYMRGRTLNDAFIVLDEAQNCTVEQMKMFLTRLGFDSKAVITGDITQSDLPGGRPLGLLQAQEILKDIDGIKFVYLSGSDVVRHSLVQKIIEAYDKQNSGK